MTKIKDPFGRIVGVVVDKVYLTERKPQHFMGMYKGFGISQSILKKLFDMDVEKVRIKYVGVKGTKILYSNLRQWMDSEKRYTFENDEQHFVSEMEMQ